jgi:hypothetical protein
MKTIIAALAVLALAGCSTLPDWTLENRAACTAAGDKALVVSMWGIFGVATIIADQDAEVVCTR